MIAWPETLIATPAASQDDLNLVTQYNLLLEASMELEQANTALGVRVDELEDANIGGTRGLRVSQLASSPQTDVLVTADKFSLSDGTVLDAVSVVIDIGNVGAGGLDVGPAVADTFYHAFVAYDSTEVMSPHTIGIASLAASPLLPAGYDKYGAVSEAPFILTDSNAELVAFSHIPGADTVRFYAAEDAGKTDNVVLVGNEEWRTMDLSGLVPPGAPGAWCMFRYDGDPGAAVQDAKFYIRPTWSAIGSQGKTLQRELFLANGPGDQRFGPFWVPLDDNGLCGYNCEGADPGGGFPPTVHLWVIGWQLEA